MRLGQLIKGADKEGKEKHVPIVELVDCPQCGEKVVKITVGKETPHPNTLEHHIQWIMLFGVKGGLAVHIATFDLGPTYGVPTVVTHANLEGLSELVAVESCNIHGLWEGGRAL